MYVAQMVELFYLGLLVTFIAFMVTFIKVTSRSKAKQEEALEHEEKPGRMDASEKKWLAVLLVIVVVGNILLLSVLVPSVRFAVWGTETPTKTVYVSVQNYNFTLPERPIRVGAGEAVEFVLTSNDVTYGFGVFRQDKTMVFQMQVVPGYENRLVWIFDETGSYDIRSTEYSGPRHSEMFLQDAILVE